MSVIIEVSPTEPLEVTVSPVVVELSAPPPVEIEIIGGTGGGGSGGGASFITGVVPPTSATGFLGDYYLDTADQVLYGPKREEAYLPSPEVSVVGYSQFSDTAGSVFTFAAPAGVQEGDMLVAFLNSQPSGLGGSDITGWKDVGRWDGTTLGGSTRWAQIVCRWYTAADPGPWTLAVNASHAGQRKIGTLVAVRNSIPPSPMTLYNSPTDTAVSVAVPAAEGALLIANWHGVMSAPNKATLLTNSGSLLVSKGYPVADGSGSADFQHVITQKITGGSGTLTLTTTGPTYAAEKTTGAILAKYPAPTATARYADVDDMVSRDIFYWAHRGGSESTWGEHAQFTYDKALAWGADVFEISLNRTSDGVWFALHDQTINRTSPSAPANSDPVAMTWAQVNAYQQIYPGITVPYLRLDTFLDRYKDTGVLLVIDPKYRSGTSLWKELVDQVLAKFPANRVIGKGFHNGVAWAQYARGRGLKTWGYLYSADVPNLGTYVANWDMLGFDVAGTQAEWNAVKAYGKPVVAHVISGTVEQTDALAKGADGLQVANVPEVIPRRATTAETVTAWPVALSSVPPGGTAGQVLAKNTAADYAANWATVSGGGGGGLDQATADGLYVNVTGDTVTGPLIVPTPTLSTHATTKAYVDTADSTHDALTTAHANLRGTASPTYADASQWVVGTAAKFAREDHKHSVSTDVPVALGSSNAAGSSSALARADHVHVVPTLDNLSDVSTAGATSGQVLVYGTGSWAPGTVSGGGGGMDQTTADARYVNITGDTATGHIMITNADRLVYALTVERTATSTAVTDAEIFRVIYGGKRATWTNEKGNLRTSNEASKGEVAMKIIAASTAEGGTGNMLEVLDIAGNVQTRIGPLGRMNFNKGIRMVGDTIEIKDSTETDSSTISQTLGADLVIAPKTNLSVNSKKITNLATPTALTDAATKAYVDTGNTTRLKTGGDSMLGYLYLVASKAGAAPFRIPTGPAPTSPVEGDIWTTTAGMYLYVGGVVQGPFGAGSGGGGGLDQSTADTLYVNVTGDTMTGTLTIADSTGADTSTIAQPLGVNLVITPKLGLTVSKPLTVSGDITSTGNISAGQVTANATPPTAAGHLTRKDYVDARTPKITPGTTAPSSPAVNDIWIDTN